MCEESMVLSHSSLSADVRHYCRGGRSGRRTFRKVYAAIALLLYNTGCFIKGFTTLKEYINLFRGHVQCFELS
jgi:hypothetical protein